MNPVIKLMQEKKLTMTQALVLFCRRIGYHSFARWAKKQGFLLAYTLKIVRAATVK